MENEQYEGLDSRIKILEGRMNIATALFAVVSIGFIVLFYQDTK